MADNEYIALELPDDLTGLYDDVLNRLGNTKPLMDVWGEIGLRSIQDTFAQEGRPNKWKQLKEATKQARARKGYWPGKILNIHGASGLYGSLSYKSTADEVRLQANKVYAATHNFGYPQNNIPQREFMLLQDEDWLEMKEAGYNYLMTGRV